MDRVSGAYKRRAQLWTMVIALLATITLNVDAVRVATELWVQPAAIRQLVPTQDAGMAMDQLRQLQLPVGWWDGDGKAFTPYRRLASQGPALPWLLTLFGWGLTALASLFGAPFWFDTLQRLVRLRGTGPKT